MSFDQVDGSPRFDVSWLEVVLNLLRNPRGLSIQAHQHNVYNKNGHILPTGQWYAPSAVKMMH